MRQQRTDNSRGQLPLATVATANVLVWELQLVGPTTLRIRITDAPTGLSLNGVPAMTRSSDGALPDSAVLDVNDITMEYPSSMPDGTMFTLPSKDPALRGQQGQYLAGASRTDAAPPPSLPVVFFGDGNTCGSDSINVANAGVLTTAVVGSGSPTSVIYIIVPTANLAPVALTGPTTAGPVDPGSSLRLVWDGGAWQVG